MLHSKTEQKTTPINKFFIDFLRGGCVGCVSITIVTPIMNFTNHKINGKTFAFPLARAFDGVLSYNASVIPMIGVSLALNTVFLQKLSQNGTYEPSTTMRLSVATVSGMVAGIVGALPEGIAQAQQLSTPKPRATHVVRNIIQHNGFFALTRGIQPTMIRQGIFTFGYMGLMPEFSTCIRKKISNPLIADLFSALVCGALVGVATAPFNTLRFKRQENFDKYGKAPSCSQLIKQSFDPLIDSTKRLNLMRGWKPRVVMSSASMFLLHEGRKIYDTLASDSQLSIHTTKR